MNEWFQLACVIALIALIALVVFFPLHATALTGFVIINELREFRREQRVWKAHQHQREAGL